MGGARTGPSFRVLGLHGRRGLGSDFLGFKGGEGTYQGLGFNPKDGLHLEAAAPHEAQRGEAGEVLQGAGLPPREVAAPDRQMPQPAHSQGPADTSLPQTAPSRLQSTAATSPCIGTGLRCTALSASP